jgi:hypothetical protein
MRAAKTEPGGKTRNFAKRGGLNVMRDRGKTTNQMRILCETNLLNLASVASCSTCSASARTTSSNGIGEASFGNSTSTVSHRCAVRRCDRTMFLRSFSSSELGRRVLLETVCLKTRLIPPGCRSQRFMSCRPNRHWDSLTHRSSRR